MKVKTADLIDLPLDWAVAQCEQEALSQAPLSFQIKEYGCLQRPHLGNWKPTVRWSQGGPIIEREHISVDNRKGDPCRAFKGTPAHYEFSMFAPEGQPLTAAMRCFVASRLGDEVDIPEELLK